MGSSTPLDGKADELLKAIVKNALNIPDMQNSYSGEGETFRIKMFTEKARKRKDDEDFAKYASFLIELEKMISTVLDGPVPAETMVECFAEGVNAKRADIADIKIDGYKLGQLEDNDSADILKELAKLVQVREKTGRSTAPTSTPKAAVAEVHHLASAEDDTGKIAQIVERKVLAAFAGSGWRAPDSAPTPSNSSAEAPQVDNDQRRFKDSAGPDECYRCGLKGHTSRGCLAKKDKNGKVIDGHKETWMTKGTFNRFAA